jgi:hypothetical protein
MWPFSFEGLTELNLPVESTGRLLLRTVDAVSYQEAATYKEK